MPKNNFLFSALILLVSIISCQKTEEKQAALQINGKSTLQLNNLSADTVKIMVTNELNLSVAEQKIDTTLAPGQTIELSITTEVRDYYVVDLGNKKYRMFAEPDATIELSIPKDKGEVILGGDYAAINKFLTTRYIFSDFNVWNEGLHEGVPISDIVAHNDSVHSAQQKQLTTYDGLPNWYKEFESLRLRYINADATMSALTYRKKAMAGKDTIPNDFLAQTIKDLPVENEEYIGVPAYRDFLNSYIELKIDPKLEKPSPQSKEEISALYESLITGVEENIENQKIKDAFHAFVFSLVVNYADYIWNEEWLGYIKDPEFANLLKTQIQTKPLLAAGDELPYFQLEDLKGNFLESSEYKGKVVLINFWASWCSPCIKEFPHENNLVEQFKNEPVTILNICISTNKELWKKWVDKYELKTENLFADETWTAKIEEAFGAKALPHSILVDQNGKVIKNKCAKASAGIDKLIYAALDTMKKEVMKP